jgi:hypothetical protein
VLDGGDEEDEDDDDVRDDGSELTLRYIAFKNGT